MNEVPKLKIKGWGEIDAEIIWVEGHLLKISFFNENKRIREVFHYSEIENFNDIYIDKDLKITNI
jgi:hypothetical protein